jgi:hypothetical protein
MLQIFMAKYRFPSRIRNDFSGSRTGSNLVKKIRADRIRINNWLWCTVKSSLSEKVSLDFSLLTKLLTLKYKAKVGLFFCVQNQIPSWFAWLQQEFFLLL